MDMAKKSNNVHDLNSHIWDSWADESGSYRQRHTATSAGVKHQYREGEMDQVDRVLYDPRTILQAGEFTNIYVHSDLHEMNLYRALTL